MTESTDSPVDIADRALATESEDLLDFAAQIADQVQSFLISVRDIAAQPDEDGIDEGLASLPYLLLEVSQLLLAGGRLGAFEDFVPEERFESDAGPDPDLDAMRDRLAILFEGLDEYAPATSRRRCGGGSSPTSPRGARPRAQYCGLSSR